MQLLILFGDSMPSSLFCFSCVQAVAGVWMTTNVFITIISMGFANSPFEIFKPAENKGDYYSKSIGRLPKPGNL